MTTVTLANPYWDAVSSDVTTNHWGELEVEPYPRPIRNNALRRTELTTRYAWTITDPDTVAFIAAHSRGRVVDPMAGTGYWAWILTQSGVDVAAYDLNPPAPDREDNHWHRNVTAHSTVRQADAVESVALHADRTLLLSWPPYGFAACPILAAYPGDRIVYIGEGEYGCCGDDDLFKAFERDWVKVAEHHPVRFAGIHDYVTVYDRPEGDQCPRC